MKKRVSKFELLRIIAMYLIVLHHSIVHGVLNVEINSELKYPSATNNGGIATYSLLATKVFIKPSF